MTAPCKVSECCLKDERHVEDVTFEKLVGFVWNGEMEENTQTD